MKLSGLHITETTTGWGRRLLLGLPSFDVHDNEGELIESACEGLSREQVEELRDACERFMAGEPL